MTPGIQSILYPVTDVTRAKSMFQQLLGTEPHSDSSYYVGFNVGGLEIGLVPGGHQQGLTGPTGYFRVDDIQGAIKTLVAQGAEEAGSPRDVGGGTLVANVKDQDGNLIGLIQPAG